jgi:hypothetical protein
MKNRFSFARYLTLVAIAAWTLFACDGEWTPLENFDYYLRETWVSNRDLFYGETEADRGRLVIGYDSITISGSVRRPLNGGYTKNIPLKGYSEESSSSRDEKRGTIYIRDKGTLKNVPYILWSDGLGEYTLTVKTDTNEETFRRKR